MMNKISKGFFSLSGLSIFIGVIGFSSSIVTMFIDINLKISIKWLLLLFVVFVSFMAILIKIIHDISIKTPLQRTFERPFRYIASENVFVIRKNDYFLNNIVVGCYVNQEDIDRLAYLGVVNIVQDCVIQIKILHDFKIFNQIPNSTVELEKIMVRPVVPLEQVMRVFREGE